MENKVFKGDMFIVPNPIITMGKSIFRGRLELFSKDFQIGEIPDSEKLIQIWVTGSGSDNWGDQGCPWSPERDFENEIEEDLLRFFFPSRLPMSLVGSMREGDQITLVHKNGFKIVLTAKQSGYRYKDFGTFEEVLKKLAA